MLNLNSGSTKPSERIDSDRDALPFPAGGVFGPAPTTSAATPKSRKARQDETYRLTRSIDADLDAIQEHLDRLTVEINEDEARDVLAAIPFRRPQCPDPQSPPPSAA